MSVAHSQSEAMHESPIIGPMDIERRQHLIQALDHILDTLAVHYQPEKVILFGSMVGENIGRWSDLDLVIIKETSQPFFRRLKEVALLCDVPVGVDYLVYTPAEFSRMVAEQNPFIVTEVVQKGRVVYERQPSEAVA